MQQEKPVPGSFMKSYTLGAAKLTFIDTAIMLQLRRESSSD